MSDRNFQGGYDQGKYKISYEGYLPTLMTQAEVDEYNRSRPGFLS